MKILQFLFFCTFLIGCSALATTENPQKISLESLHAAKKKWAQSVAENNDATPKLPWRKKHLK